MADRTKARTIEHRQHVPWRVYDYINRRTCLHVDGWLIRDDASVGGDGWIFILHMTAGGQQKLNTITFNVDAFGTVTRVDNPSYIPSRRSEFMLGEPILERVHWQYIVPLVHTRAPGFTPPNSVILHYVWIDPRIVEPTDGIVNYYDSTARAERDAKRRIRPLPEMTPAVTPPAPRLSARDRSVLRTLDKLLK